MSRRPSLLDLFGTLSPVHILYATWRGGKLVGSDGQGNRYYRVKGRKGMGRERRFVVYAGAAEASAVPPEWHGWLHFSTDTPPDPARQVRRPWQKPHLPNQTGGGNAYRPPGHVLAAGRRAPATGDYEAWTP